MKRIATWGTVVAAALAVAAGGYWYYRHGQYYPSTNDAYVKANVVKVTPQVSGRVAQIPVGDQARVHEGQLLFRIDPAPFRDRVRGARAQLALARQQVLADDAAVTAARAAVEDRNARLDNAQTQYRRAKTLAKRNAGSAARLDNARATMESAKAALRLARAKLHQAKVKLGKRGDKNEQVRQARAKLDQARLDLKHTRVTAPCTGQVSGVGLNAGDVVGAGHSQFALVCNSRYWVYANFKETDLPRIRPGQTAAITVDMYPGKTFHGIVENVNPASGAAFSLLPPENATGNWVKVTQRVPVRILVVDGRADYPLRVQTSTEVTIDTGTKAKPLGRPRGDGLTNAQALDLAREKNLVAATE